MARRNSHAKGQGPLGPPPFLAGIDKRSVILRAAHTLFLRDGFSSTSMDAVTAAAGVSKATVYAYFSSKEALFETLVIEGSENALRMIPPLIPRGLGVERELTDFFEPLLTLLFVEGGYAWDRMVASEAARQPKNAELFFRCTIERIAESVEHYLRQAPHDEELQISDPRASADALLAMVLVAPLHRALLLGAETVDFRRSLSLGIDVFVRSHRSPASQKRASR